MESTLITVRRQLRAIGMGKNFSDIRHSTFHNRPASPRFHRFVYAVYESRKNSSEKKLFTSRMHVVQRMCLLPSTNWTDTVYSMAAYYDWECERHTCVLSLLPSSILSQHVLFGVEKKLFTAVEKKTKNNMKMRSVRSSGCIWRFGIWNF